MKKLLLLLMLSSCVAMSLAGCGGDGQKVIKVGGTETARPWYKAVSKEYAKLGYKSEFVLFDSNVLPITGANDGSIDISFGQHKKFMDSFNKKNNGDLVMLQPFVYHVGMGLYSEKYKSVDQIPDGAKIAIMNDAMNMDRALKILQIAGLIKLSDKVKDSYSIIDIAENRKKLKIIDMEQAQTVRSLSEMDAAVVFFSHMTNAGKDLKTYLVRDNVKEEYPSGVIVKAKNKNEKWAVDYNNCARMETVRAEIRNKFPNLYDFFN